MTHKKISFFISFFVHMLFLSLISMVVFHKTTPPKIQEPKKLLISLKSLEQMISKEVERPVTEVLQQEIVTKVEPKKVEAKPKETPKQAQPLIPSKPIEQPVSTTTIDDIASEVTQVQVAREVPQESVKTTEAPKVLFDHKEYAKANFNSLRDGIIKNLIYPQVARRMKQSGVVELLVVVGVGGKIVDVSISKSSGYSVLDKSALEAAKSLEGNIFEKPLEETKIKLPVEFILN